MGLSTGEAMDLTTGWDFTLQRHREAALEYVRKAKPKLVIGSPQCRMFSSMQNLNPKRHTMEHEEQLVEAKEHIRFVVQVYKEQVKAGRYFLHEHPAGASSWDMGEIRELSKELGVTINIADQCMYGLRT